MFKWLREMLMDPTGANTQAVRSFRDQVARSTEVCEKIRDIADQLRETRESRNPRPSSV